MSRIDGILHLVLNAHPWDEIAAGRKPVEYRAMHWYERIVDRVHLFPGPVQIVSHYRLVRFQRAFQRSADGKVPTMLWEIASIDRGPADPRWTYGIVPAGEEFVRIWLGARL